MSTLNLGPLNLDAFKQGAEAGLKSVAVQAAANRVAAPKAMPTPPQPGDAEAVKAVLDAIRAIATVAHEVRLTAETRLHYLRCIRLNLANAEDRIAGDDDIPPCVAEKFGDIAADIHHAAANPED